MRALTTSARVALVGAGPQALTAAVYLRQAGVDASDLVVIDPSGDWLTSWHRWFAHLGIEHLRSPAVHHPHPRPYALLDFASARNRSGELLAPYSLPSTALFADFCRHLVDAWGLSSAVRPDVVDEVSADGVLITQRGDRIEADHVVWATNPSISASMDLTVPPVDPTVHCWKDANLDDCGGSVAVVGGGLTGAHLVERALERGAHVEWLTRRPVGVRDFDTDPGWLGPKMMDEFLAEPDLRVRLEQVLDARGGGTVPPWMMKRIDRAERSGRLCRRSGDVVVLGGGSGPKVAVDGVPVVVDRVWLATGDQPCLDGAPPLDRLCRSLGVEVIAGRPVLDAELRVPGSVVQVMGRLAQLRLGPVAGNLSGARRGAEAVVGSVVGHAAMAEIAYV